MVATAPATLGPAEIGAFAARAERLGFDTLHVSETIHDPFTVAAFAVQATTAITVRTSMVLAFPRSPMITAYAAWDLARLSGGRFQLGIASQVRGNIVGRFSTTWSEPVSRMADYIRALRAIFHAFQTGERLNYVGAHYTFDTLQSYFNPGPLDHPHRPSGPVASTRAWSPWPARWPTGSSVTPPTPTRRSCAPRHCRRWPVGHRG